MKSVQDILSEILPQILPIIGVALTSILLIIIKKIGNAVVEYIGKKKESIEQQINLEKHREVIEIGKEIWNIVEEKFRITENLEEFVGSKANEFDKLLSEKFPLLTMEQLEEIRQTIAGEINKGKDVLFKNSFKEEVRVITEENAKLIQENNDLKSQLNINNIIM